MDKNEDVFYVSHCYIKNMFLLCHICVNGNRLCQGSNLSERNELPGQKRRLRVRVIFY